MTPESQRSLRAELPAHAEWMRRLARSLVRDEAAADDLCQDAALAALRQDVRPGALGPWLARVTRNFARRGWRTEARRTARERSCARAEAVPGADESAARLELERQLLDELAALEPAVRHALVRRYLDGKSAARIARETGEPAATVRWRLQRGLAELRARLDRRAGGDGIQWRLALAPLCGGGPWSHLLETLRPLAGAATIPGALTMNAASQVLAAGALATALGLGVWWGVAREAEPRAAAPVEPVAAAPALSLPPAAEEAAARPAESRREALAASPAPARADEPDPAPAADPPRVVGRCVDQDLVSIGSARVSQTSGERVTAVQADGNFALEVASVRGDVTLFFEAPGFASRFVELALPAEGAVNLGDVVLAPGGRVHGRVVDALGASFEGASISVTDPDLWGSLEQVRTGGPAQRNVLRARSGADGLFEVEGVALGPVRVWAGAEGMRYAVSAPLVVSTGDPAEVELVLEPVRGQDRITGIVLSPAGQPVPGAGLSGMERRAGGARSVAFEAGPDGRFEIPAKARHVYDLAIVDPEGRWASVPAHGLLPGTHGLELRFAEARWIEVRVRPLDGQPLAECRLVAENDEVGELEHAIAERGSEGRARLRVPGLPFTVRADARGYALAVEGPFQPEEAPGELVFTLVPEPGVRGRVLAEGSPLRGATVTLRRYHPGSRIEHKGYAALVSPHPEDRTRTDSDGSFTLKLREAGTYLVRAEAEGWAARETGLMELDPSAGRTDVELALGPGGVLEGRVLVAAGRDPAGVIVAVNRGDAHARTVRSAADGSYRFEGLMAGPWQLLRGSQDVHPGLGGDSYSGTKTPTVIPFNCTITDGETTWKDLDLRDFEPCRVEGTLLVNGVPARDWSVTAWPGESRVGTPPSTSVVADGTFTLSVDEAGPLRLAFSPPEVGVQARIDVRLEVRPGANEWRDDLSMGRVQGRVLSALASGDTLFYCSAEGVTPACWLPIEPDAEGHFLLPFVPAGRGSIRCASERGWETLAETEVPARGERVVDVP